jgi:Aspartyl/Asparaginyl beta-hydroxylase
MTYGEFVAGIRVAFEHRGGVKTLLLGKIDPLWFSQIQRECSSIIAAAESSDVTRKGHVTNWTRPTGRVRQFSLFNMSGDSADTRGDYGYLGDVAKKRLVFPEHDALARFAKLFIPALRNLRLNGMGTSSALNAHEEMSITPTPLGSSHIVRFHLPVFTNPHAAIYLDDEQYHYDEGCLYFFNHGCVHAASNNGTEPRYHLVLDAFLDRALFARFFPGQTSPDPGFVKMQSIEMHGTHYHFPNFARENGSIVEGPINYGRRAPRAVDYYKKNYPSMVRFIPRRISGEHQPK